MSLMSWLEGLSYVVTIVGLPLAIVVFLYERRQERENEEEALYLRLSDGYNDFLRLALDHADLQLFGEYQPDADLKPEQVERKRLMFAILVSLFERAYISLYDESMDRHATRLWQSWQDYMGDWCKRPDFRAALPELLEGEDDAFSHHILGIAALQAERAAPGGA